MVNTPHSDRTGSFGKRVRSARHAKQLTQYQLADLVGVSIGAIRDLEQGRVRSPQQKTATRLAEILDLDEPGSLDYATDRETRLRNSLWVGVLGPLRVIRDGQETPLPTVGAGNLLSLLALTPGERVRQATALDALSTGSSPDSAMAAVRSYVRQLQSLLNTPDEHFLFREPHSYRLRLTAGQLDLLAFRRLAAQARDAIGAGSAVTASALYEHAVSLWRGEPLEEADWLCGHPQIAALTEERIAVTTEYARLASANGWHDMVLPHLRILAARDPLDERSHGALMTALAGTGRQAEALLIYENLRRRLDEELGIFPGPAIRAAQVVILRQEVPEPRPFPWDAMRTAAALA